jgi:hypothetical protein
VQSVFAHNLHDTAPQHTATNVESRLLELAATSVRYLLVHFLACSLLRTALETSVKSLGLLGIFWILGTSSSCWGILAFASCGRLQCLPTAIAMGPVAGQAPSRPRARHDFGGVGGRARWQSRDGGCWRRNGGRASWCWAVCVCGWYWGFGVMKWWG